MTELEHFRQEVERYLAEHDMAPTMFGRLFAHDPLFVFQLRQGREPRTKTRQKVLEAMREIDPAGSTGGCEKSGDDALDTVGVDRPRATAARQRTT